MFDGEFKARKQAIAVIPQPTTKHQPNLNRKIREKNNKLRADISINPQSTAKIQGGSQMNIPPYCDDYEGDWKIAY